MKLERIISVLAILAIVFVTSCSKFEPLNEKEVNCVEHVSNSTEIESSAIILEEDNGNPNITDPDHDEDHDKDDSNDSKEN